MDERYIAAVDPGSYKTAFAVAHLVGENIQIVYYNQAPSEGVRYGGIFNPSKLAKVIKPMIEDAQEQLHIKVNEVVVSLPRYEVRQVNASAEIQRDSQTCIEKEEIEELKMAATESFPLENEIKECRYGAVAQAFSTEYEMNMSEEEIIGIPSETLQGIFSLFIGRKATLSYMDFTFKTIGVKMSRRYFNAETTAKAVLKPEEMKNGVALVEIGAGVTSVTIFSNDIMRYYAAIPFGGKDVTNDIKAEGNITTTLAENIKLAFGACMPNNLANMSEKILYIQSSDGGQAIQYSVKYLSEVITARMEEIYEAILWHIEKSGYKNRLNCGIVLTGGGANLTNSELLLKEMSGYDVRYGRPRNLVSASEFENIFALESAALMGLIIEARRDSTVRCCTRDGAEETTRHSEHSDRHSDPERSEGEESQWEESPEPVEGPRHSERSEESQNEAQSETNLEPQSEANSELSEDPQSEQNPAPAEAEDTNHENVITEKDGQGILGTDFEVTEQEKKKKKEEKKKRKLNTITWSKVGTDLTKMIGNLFSSNDEEDDF